MIQNQKIREQIDSINWRSDYEAVIEFYESNQLYFDNKSNFANFSEIDELAHIQISYTLALDEKKHYTKASKVLPNIDILVEKLKNTEFYAKVNERYMFASGMNAQRLKNYEHSQYFFSRLVKIDPENALYKDWYESNKDWFFYKKTRIVGYIGLGIIIITSFFGGKLNMTRTMIMKFEFVGLLSIFGGFYAPQIKRFFKKLDKSNN